MTTPSIQTAMALHAQGRLAEAERAYGSVLQQNPDQFDALHLLGVIKLQRGDAEAAHALICRAVERRPQATDALCNLSAALLALNRHAEALDVCRRTLALDPGDVETLYNQGQALLHLHRYHDALDSYDKVLAAKPAHVNSLLGRGNALTGLARFEEALASCNTLLALTPTHVLALNNQGSLLIKLDRPAEALLSFDRALAVRPDDVTLLRNRATALGQLERHEDALASLDRALAVEPDHVATLKDRASTLRALDRNEDAVASFERLLRLRPDDVEALVDRGVAQLELGRTEEALASCEQVLQIEPDHVEALNNRGVALAGLGRREEAFASYERALALRPNYADALNNRANVLAQIGRLKEALAASEKALAVEPGHVKALVNRSMLLGKLKQFEAALAGFEQALAIRPADLDARRGRGFLLRQLHRHEQALADFEQVAAVKPDTPYLLGALVHAKMQLCDWSNIPADIDRLRTAIRAGKPAAEPFPLLATPATPEEQLRAAQIFAADKYPPSASPAWRGERYSHDRIRIGYLSGEFGEQATSYLIAELLELHDRERFEVSAISSGTDDGSRLRQRIERAVDRFVDVGERSDQELSALLRDLEIDILVNLNGYFGEERTGAFALRPAPIQVNYLGYPGTMGVDYIDYIIADPFVIPPHERSAYSEKVVYLPGTYQVNDSKRQIAAGVVSRREAGLPDGAFVFCCFNQNYKTLPNVFDVWMRLLQQVEDSVLWLRADNATAVGNLRREAEKRGVASNRIVFAPFMKLDQHLRRHRLADLFLDTLPLNAHTTASDALWAGLPVVSCAGTTFAGRVAASVLNAVGLPELVTDSLAQYEAVALRLARDPAALAALKARLERNRLTCPLFNSDRFRRHIEAAYTAMWETWQRGEEPRSFSVDPI